MIAMEVRGTRRSLAGTDNGYRHRRGAGPHRGIRTLPGRGTMLAHDASASHFECTRRRLPRVSHCHALVVERALGDPRAHQVDLRLCEEWTAERHALTADASGTLDLLHEIAVVGIARGDALERRLLDARHADDRCKGVPGVRFCTPGRLEPTPV